MDREKVLSQLVAIEALVACVRDELLCAPEEPAPAVTACPYCGEDDKVEDTSTAEGLRMTCLECGKSWRPTNG